MKHEINFKCTIEETNKATFLKIDEELNASQKLFVIDLLSMSLIEETPKEDKKEIKDLLKRIAKHPDWEFSEMLDYVLSDYYDYERFAEEFKESEKEYVKEEIEKQKAELAEED